jgi:acyl-CoA synthetase (NDP forming)
MATLPLQGQALAQALLSPASVALVGASDDLAKTSARPQRYLRDAGFTGAVYPVNPHRRTVQGQPAFPSLAALPEVPEHVFVLSSTATVLPVIEECGRLGVGLVTVLASGFSESGPEGVLREAGLREAAARYGVRVLGPSSIGVVNPRNGLLLTANAAFAEPRVPAGRLFVASHSGSMLGALLSRGIARHVGFAGMVSVGGEADLSLGEVCAATLDDPEIDGYLLFLESLHHGQALRRFALEAAGRGKPVVAYKLGRSAVAAEMATTHTGALAGEDDIADAFLRDCGIARVGVLEALLETMPLALRVPLSTRTQAPRVGVVTTTGGGAAMAVDQLGLRGITVQPPSPETLALLRQGGIAVGAGRVVDLTLVGVQYQVMKATLDVMLAAPEFDMVLATIGSSARFQPGLAVKPLIDSISHARPLVAMMVPDAPEALAALTAAQVPCFRDPEACADAIAAVYNRRVPHAVATLPAATLSPNRSLSEAQAYAVLDALGVPHAPAVVVPIGQPPGELPFGYPVAAKICSDQIAHKTEAGGVVLGIGSAAELSEALVRLRANVARYAPDLQCEAALVQPMVQGLGEALIGYRVDPDAGPIIMLAAGGIWAEVARDRSIRLAPVGLESAREMVREVRVLQVLTGLRGRPRGDLEALARAIVALSQLASRPELGIAEAEVNPLMILPEGQGVLAVDALAIGA